MVKEDTSPTSTEPSTLASVKKLPAPTTTKQCPSISQTNRPPRPVTHPPLVMITTFLDSSPSKNASLLSPRPLPLSYPTPLSPPKMSPHHSNCPLLTKRPTWSTPQSPLIQQRCYSAPTQTSTTLSMPSCLASSPPYTDEPWPLAEKPKKGEYRKPNCTPKSQQEIWTSPHVTWKSANFRGD